MAELDLDQLSDVLKEFFKTDPRILAGFIFGSRVDGFALPSSDLDIALLFTEEIGLWEEMRLQTEMSTIVHFDQVDVLNLNKAPLRLKFTIISNGRLIYEGDPLKVTDFIEEVVVRHRRQVIRNRLFFQDWDAGLKEDYADGK